MIITAHGQSGTLDQWCARLGVSRRTIRSRIDVYGADRALRMTKYGRSTVQFEHSIDDVTPYEEDEECQRIVRDNPDGATLEIIGATMGVCRERIRQIEEEALEKLRLGLRIIEAVGEMRAELILRRLRGRGPNHYRQALHDAKTRRM